MPDTDLLSKREIEVLRYIARGHSNADTGGYLFISEDTVKTHLKRIYRKLGAINAPHAVALAYTCRIFLPDELNVN